MLRKYLSNELSMSRCDCTRYQTFKSTERVNIMSPENFRSEYLAATTSELVDRAVLSAEDKQKVEQLEGTIKVMREAARKANSNINKLRADGKLKDHEAVLQHGLVDSDALRVIAENECEIRKIMPSWSSTASDNIKNALDSASQGTINGAEKTGEVVGNTVRTPFQALRALVNGVKKGANK